MAFKMKGNPFKRNFELRVGKGQGIKRKGKYILDPDAPGGKYGPGYEPPVTDKDMYGERDFSEHNIHARKTEGTIAEQEARRKKAEDKLIPEKGNE